MSSAYSLPYPAPQAGIDYTTLHQTDKTVLNRLPTWAEFPVAFCREAIDWWPHWYQEELLNDMSLFVAACWSRQLGKSYAIAHKALWTAFCYPDSDIIIVAPSRRQAYMLYDKIVKALKRSPLLLSSVLGDPTKEKIEFTNGARIFNLPAGDTGDTIRGYSIKLLILEEAAFIPNDVIVAIEQGLAATGGCEIMISTPRGRSNAFYKAFNQSHNVKYDMTKEGRQEVGDWVCYRYTYRTGLAVTTKDGFPQLSLPHLEKQRRDLTEWQFKAEYEAMFIEDADAYFPLKTIEATFNNAFRYLTDPMPNANYFMGIDISKGQDMTALGILQRYDVNPFTKKPLTYPHMRGVNLQYWKVGGIKKQFPHILAQVRLWKPTMIYFDKTSMGEFPFEELQQTYKLPIEGIHFSPQEKINMYGNLSLLMSAPAEIEGWKRRLQLPRDEEAEIQFTNLMYEIPLVTSKQTGIKHESTSFSIYPSSGHDDIPDAIALACRGASSDYSQVYHASTAIRPEEFVARNIDENIPISSKDGMVIAKKTKRRLTSRSDRIFWK